MTPMACPVLALSIYKTTTSNALFLGDKSGIRSVARRSFNLLSLDHVSIVSFRRPFRD